MYLYHNTENDLVIDVEKIHYRRQVIETLKNRFTTYGYEEIYTSNFENYDLYANMNGSVNHQEMIKTIDNKGQVLVLRPDITIPITQELAQNNKSIQEDLRYFYVLDVFRQAADTNDERESTQAGVEYFGNDSPETDAEVVALAIHLLKDLQVGHFKIELGHAGFFKQLIKEVELNEEELTELIQLIQAKNISEIEQFLSNTDIDNNIAHIITSLPFLYGNPLDVLDKANKLPLNQSLIKPLNNIKEIYEGLTAYGLEEHLVIDLSLINQMDYYSDIIFQGFIHEIGKPVLMGGRYDTLAKQFGASIPAIGFACDVETLLTGVSSEHLSPKADVDVTIIYDKKKERKAVTFANQLRDANYKIITYESKSEKERIPKTTSILEITEGHCFIREDTNTTNVGTVEDIIKFLEQLKERN